LTGNIVIIAYSGFKAAKNGFNLMGCGLLGLIIHFFVFWIMSLIEIGVTLVLFGPNIFYQQGMIVELFRGNQLTYYGIGFELMIIFLIGGILINFIIGAIGGILGGAKK
jgi:hypothetical protein